MDTCAQSLRGGLLEYLLTGSPISARNGKGLTFLELVRIQCEVYNISVPLAASLGRSFIVIHVLSTT